MPARTAARVAFGENIRKLRLSRAFSQQELAARCGLSADALRRLELGRISPSLDTLSKLAAGLDLSLTTLFTTFETRQRDEVAELTDFLAHRTPQETRHVTRLVEALFPWLAAQRIPSSFFSRFVSSKYSCRLNAVLRM